MSTINNPQPESPTPEPAPEELVAYLDGELSPDECRQVEERLATDADYRQQLRELDQAWEALDSLPATSAGDDFARTTIEMVTLAAREDQKERTVAAAATNRNRRRLWAIIGGLAVAASFVAARLLLPDANARLLTDLPVITQMDLLDQIQDVDFLRKLSEEVPVDKLASDESAVEGEVAKFAAASEPSPEARRQWIESLPSQKKADLAAQAAQFGQLSTDERERLIKLERQITADPNAAKLQMTLAAYGQWLARRTSGDLSRLRGLATDDRIRQIRDTLRREDEQAARRLTEADAKELKQEIFEIYDEVKDKEDFARFLRRRARDDRGPRFEATTDEKALFAVSWALWDNNDIDDRTQKRIIRDLTPEAQKHLEQLRRRGDERGDRGERFVKTQLWQWMREAMQPKLDDGAIEEFFAKELDENQREHLLSLRRDEMEARLAQMYLGSRFGVRGAEWFGRFGERPRGTGLGRPGLRPDRPPGPDGRPRPGQPPGGPPPPDPGAK